MTRAPHVHAAALIVVGGHESDGGEALEELARHEPLHGVPTRVATTGRALERALDAADGRPGHPVVVLPMTLGRDPRMVSDTARTVRWRARGERTGTIALAPPFGTPDHLVSWLRGACLRLRDDEAAVLIAAAPSDPFDDAELHRVAALVRAHGRHRLVEVGLRAGDGSLEEGIDRCRRLGAARVAIVPAAFGRPADAAEPLLSEAAAARVVVARATTACHRLAEHGDDGVAAAHAADHLHGFAHSHEGEHGHTHPHDHVHAAAG